MSVVHRTCAARSPKQGLTALSVPEAEGGLGMDDSAWALMTQELGYYAIPDSLADTAYVATGLLTSLPSGHPASSSLPRIAEGTVRIADQSSRQPAGQ